MNRQREEAIPGLIRDALEVYRDDPAAVAILDAEAHRLQEPLRVAVAGMVKAGKSTLINAILGDEVAPTDAGECTRTVTWYRFGETPRVTVHPISGGPQALPIGDVGGRLSFDLASLRAEDVERVEVEWPADMLRDLILIDTPGIASLSGEISERTNQFLLPGDGPSEADAIIYVLRHLHEADLTFLKALRETVGAQSGAVNALAVLSRADEIGAGRIESLLAARDIARRYRQDETLRSLAIGVLPVAGRLAQTARTLSQSEREALVELATLDRAERERMLISADRFVHARGGAAGSAEDRATLLDRFGLFGIRLATVLIQNGFFERDALADELVRRSGLGELLQLITTQFRVRDAQLKARAAIAAVDALLRRRPHAGGDALATTIERIVAESHEFEELRLLATAHTVGIELPTELTADMLRLVGSEGVAPTERLGLAPDSSVDEVRSRALEQVHRWRARAESPLTDRATADLCRIVVRSSEGILAETETRSGPRPATPLLLAAEPGAGLREEA